MEMTTIIDGIAERIGRVSFADLPPEAVYWAKAAILDTVGVTLAGAAEPCTRIVARVLSAGTGQTHGECLIFGADRRAAPLDDALHAKFINCAGRVLPPAQVERLRRALSRLDEAGSLRDIIAAITLSSDH
jgi:2-methylcitrate dehydratase PrpD